MSDTFTRPLNADERIVILGDSITQAGNRPGGFVTVLREAVGREDVVWRPTGVSGHRIEDAGRRVASDVLPLRPSIVVVFVGVNDVWHQARGNVLEFTKAQAQLKELIQELRKAETPPDIVLATPMVIGERHDGTNSLDRDLEDLSDLIRNVATEEGCHLLDLRRETIQHLKKHNPNQKSHSVLTIDGVHLNREGNRFLAQTIAHYFELVLPKPESRSLRHLVLLKFNAGASREQIQEALECFQGLGTRIDSIVSLECGTNNSPEGKTQGYTHAFVLTFQSAADRDAYLPHPEHQKFVDLAGPILEDVCVFDYWAEQHPTIR